MGPSPSSDNNIIHLRAITTRLEEVAGETSGESSLGQLASETSNPEPGPEKRVIRTRLVALIVVLLVPSATIGAMVWQGVVRAPWSTNLVIGNDSQPPAMTLTVPSSIEAEKAGDGTISANAVRQLKIAPAPETPLISRPDETGRIADLVAHGQKMIDLGQIAGARSYFKRAAEAGSADAAYALGMTYDPSFISDAGVQGMKADPAEARAWYERARELGSQAAKEKLEELKHVVKDRLRS